MNDVKLGEDVCHVVHKSLLVIVVRKECLQKEGIETYQRLVLERGADALIMEESMTFCEQIETNYVSSLFL